MAKTLVLYYSAYGHIERMAYAVAEGVRSVSGSEVTLKRVAELVPEDAARKAGMKIDHKTRQMTIYSPPTQTGIGFATSFGSRSRARRRL